MFRFFNRDRNNKSDKKADFWVSYADIMAALLLMFILLLTVVIFDYQETLALRQLEIDEQEKKIQEKTEEIEQKTEEVDKLLGVREEIILALQQKFADTDLSLEIDSQTGAIRLPGGVFFETDSTEITDEGIEFLENFIPRYVEILLGPEFREYVAQIIIEGHTDDIGSYMYNLELSQNRAFEVVRLIYTDQFTDFQYKETLREYLTANGRSFSQPIFNESGNLDRDSSRRVEFKFRLKDTEMIERLMESVGE